MASAVLPTMPRDLRKLAGIDQGDAASGIVAPAATMRCGDAG